jgi:3-hydroxybutyryl-CoA dehydrogenase
MNVRKVAVIGLGTMGAGIAEVFARAGCQVTAVELDPAALERGLATLGKSLDKAVSRGKLGPEDRDDIAGRVQPAGSVSAAAGVDLAVEVVPERLEIKRQVFAALDEACGPEAILATNTSSLSVTEIAAGTRHPGRVVGMHFFNPAPVMKLVEVVTTVVTDPGTGAAVADLAKRLGKMPVQVTDRAGFVANALLLPYLNHAVALLETGYASREDIDAAMVTGVGLPMGPLTLLDLIGLDTSLSVLDVLHAEFGGTRFLAAPLLRRLVAAGLTGRKTGRGFYEYSAGQGSAVSSTKTMGNEERPAVMPVTLVGTLTEETARLAARIEQAGWPVTIRHDGDGPAPVSSPAGPAATPLAEAGLATTGGLTGAGFSGTALAGTPAPGPVLATTGRLVLIMTPDAGVGVLATALAVGEPGAVGLHLIEGPPGGGPLAEIITTPRSDPAAAPAARRLAGELGLTVAGCPDRAGFLAGALLYPHLNDAAAMLEAGYASAADIDTAMTLGCGYPRGPIELLDQAGPGTAAAVLSRMHAQYGDPAYAPVPLLAEHAAAGLPLR